ncbi:hypothetical protein ACVGW8_13410, partial [Enterobacter hormaechei]
MSTSTIEALASPWARIAQEPELPADYEGTATPQPQRASEPIQEQIRERIVATNQNRLFLSLIQITHPTTPKKRSGFAACGFKKRGG